MAFNFSETSYGLDISDQALRLVKLVKKNKKITLTFFAEAKIPESALDNGEVKDEKVIVEIMNKLAKAAKIKKNDTHPIISVLPETKTYIAVVEIPTAKTDDVKKKKEKAVFDELVTKEIVNHIPLNPDDIYFDWQVLSKTPSLTKLLIGAVPKQISDSYYSILDKGGLKPHVLEIEAAPIIRSLLKEDDLGSKIIIDFGAIRTGLITFNEGTVNFTVTLPISGENITQTIATTLNIDPKQAEESKIVCGLDQEKCEGALLKVLMDPINKMASHIKRAVSYYETNFPKATKISEIVLCGGGANFIKIDQVLQEKTGIKVSIGNPMTNLTENKKNKIPKEKLLSYTTAIGLALQSFQKK